MSELRQWRYALRSNSILALTVLGLALFGHSADRATVINAQGGFVWGAYNQWGIRASNIDHQTKIVTTNYLSAVVSDGTRLLQTNEVVTTIINNYRYEVYATNADFSDRLPPVFWSIRPNDKGQTISSDGVVDIGLVTNITYTITATAYDRSAKDITDKVNPIYRRTIYTAYVSDFDGSLRDRLNNEAYAILQGATLERVDSEGNNVWKTFIAPMSHTHNPITGRWVGNLYLWAASKHVLVSANHYAYKFTGEQAFYDGVTHATVRKMPWVHLYDWALSNGFTTNDLKAVSSIGDISLVPCDKSVGEVPDGCIPYFMSPEQRDTYFNGDMTGLVCWEDVQDYNWGVPNLISGNDGNWDEDEKIARTDISSRLSEMNPRYRIYGGDSGKCVFILLNGKPVVISAQLSAGRAGPDYIAAFPMIKAYVEAYGDELKTLSDEDFNW